MPILKNKIVNDEKKLKMLNDAKESLEIKLIRAKQDLGEAINVVNIFEVENIRLKKQIENLLSENFDNLDKGDDSKVKKGKGK